MRIEATGGSHLSVVQHSDQFYCRDCQKTWDANDIDPPPCTAPESDEPKKTVWKRWQGGPACLQNLPKDEPKATVTTTPTGRRVSASPAFAYPYGTPASGARLAVPPVPPEWIEQYMSGVDKVVPSVGAYVLNTDNASTLVYALDALQAMEFFINTMGNWMTASQMYSISVDRMSSMDQYGTGRTPRVEMNPRVMESASLARSNSGRQHKIVNIVEFSNILKVSK
ncbi:hypothetical protein OIM36_22880 [Salmonella enterica subsp. enterica serovar Infantis]|nr:hypothetical protein [Salmonella enterica subsp. enterica serovar Infantis]